MQEQRRFFAGVASESRFPPTLSLGTSIQIPIFGRAINYFRFKQLTRMLGVFKA